MAGVVLRDAAPGDANAIAAIIEAAFLDAEYRSGNEARIVEALREGCIVGHAAASPVRVAHRDIGWFGLGPVSVLPHCQRSGIGARLVAAVLERLRAQHADGCVVLGDPAYYRRFGFRVDARLYLPGVPAEYFQCLAFAAAVPAGAVAYAPALALALAP